MALATLPPTQVLIAGGGPTGIVAALAAARSGAQTLLVEQYGFLGGELVTGLNIHGFFSPSDEHVVRGIGWEIIERLQKMNGASLLWKIGVATDPDLSDPKSNRPVSRLRDVSLDPEVFKYLALEMLDEAGVDLLLHTFVSDVVMENGTIRGLIAESKSGRMFIQADRVIDCTGDGDVAAMAGVSFEKGRPSDGVRQPLSMMFTMGGVDLERTLEIPGCRRGEVIGERQPWQPKCMHFTIPLDQWKERLQEAFPEIPKERTFSRFTGNSFRNGIINGNTTAHLVRVDATNVNDLSRAEVDGRKLAYRTAKFLQENVPGFEDSFLLSTAAHIGVRETRRIIGEYRLSYEDVIEARQKDDVVALGCYYVDIHNYSGVSSAYEPAKGTRIREGRGYDIPYGCLVPQGIENLLVAGRCFSGTHEGQASARVMATCMAMGHAAGVAVAHSIKEAVAPRHIKVSDIQKLLLSQGAYIGERFLKAEKPTSIAV